MAASLPAVSGKMTQLLVPGPTNPRLWMPVSPANGRGPQRRHTAQLQFVRLLAQLRSGCSAGAMSFSTMPATDSPSRNVAAVINVCSV